MIVRKSEGLSNQIYYDLRKKIIELEYLPGDQISEAKLAELYKVSRTPIKHSLAVLENEGVVFVKPQIGTFVSKIDTTHVHEFFDIRMLLELSIIETVRQNITKDYLEQLKNNIEEQFELCENWNHSSKVDISKKFWELDNSFHKLIFDSINKGYIWDYILKQSSQFNRFRVLSAATELEDVRVKVEEHNEILNYILGNEKQAITIIYNTHLFGSLSKTISKLEDQYPEYF